MISTGLGGPDRYLDVTASTRQEIEAIRSRNPRWKSLLHGIQSFDYSQMPSHMAQTRALFHKDSLSTKHPGVRSSGFYPELTEENLEIIARNDLVELCRKFYTWKIK